MRVAQLGGAVQDVMDERIDALEGDVGIAAAVEGAVEQRARVDAALVAFHEIMPDRLGVCIEHSAGLAAVEGDVEQFGGVDERDMPVEMRSRRDMPANTVDSGHGMLDVRPSVGK